MLQKLSGQKHVDAAVFLRPDVMYLNELPVFLFNHFPPVRLNLSLGLGGHRLPCRAVP